MLEMHCGKQACLSLWETYEKINTVGTSNADVPLADPGMYQLDITLRRGQSLAARDRGGMPGVYLPDESKSHQVHCLVDLQ
ncbi:hypothetical protein STEG23_026297, partial [Scotinomys teguina]